MRELCAETWKYVTLVHQKFIPNIYIYILEKTLESKNYSSFFYCDFSRINSKKHSIDEYVRSTWINRNCCC